MRILVVASAPQSRCGIARYASQQQHALRREGHVVDYASLDGGTEGVEHVADIKSRRGCLRLRKISTDYDRVILHFQQDLFFRAFDPDEIASRNLLLAAWFKSHGNVEVVVHELNGGYLVPGGVGRKIRWTEALKWGAAASLVFHTRTELEQFRTLLPKLAHKAVLKEHAAMFTKRRECTREEARAELGLPAGGCVFLCIGFIQESKGFDRAVQAMSAVQAPSARLYVVGAVRTDHPGDRRHRDLLRRLCSRDARVTFVEGFLDDAAFDTWLIAADAVICPYRSAWSSGVAARCALHGRRVIMARTGGLPDQRKPGDVVFHDELELEAAMDALAAGRSLPAEPPTARADGLKLAVVVPWFGPDLPGGAETQARKTVEKLHAAGAEIEVLTTTIRDYYADWTENARPVGRERVVGVLTRRFPVEPRRAEEFNRVNARICRREPVSAEELQLFQDEMVKSPGLIRHLAQSSGEYDLVLFFQYMFQTTLQGSRACPGRAVLVPCLHDEGYAGLAIYRQMLRDARGILFNSAGEMALAKRLVPGLEPAQCALTGEGVETDWSGDGERFRARWGLEEYVAFCGRKDGDKNFPLLLEYFRRYRDERAPALALVVAGPGRATPEPADRGSVIDLGFVSEQDKRDLLAGSLCLVQPSLLESFSIVLMEAWIARRPALVHSRCDVTRGHVEASGGGLHFETYPEFAACLDRLRRDAALAEALGTNGRRYVVSHFAWNRVLARSIDTLRAWKRAALGGAPREVA
jgi:glycosyltransferase involved in cell wall biosynthesis